MRVLKRIGLAFLALMVATVLVVGAGCSGRKKSVVDSKTGKDLLKPLELGPGDAKKVQPPREGG